jgi:hypothetical protein
VHRLRVGALPVCDDGHKLHRLRAGKEPSRHGAAGLRRLVLRLPWRTTRPSVRPSVHLWCACSEVGKHLSAWADTEGILCLECEIGTSANAGSADCNICDGYEGVVAEGESGVGFGYVWIPSRGCVKCDGTLSGRWSSGPVFAHC